MWSHPYLSSDVKQNKNCRLLDFQLRVNFDVSNSINLDWNKVNFFYEKVYTIGLISIDKL